MIENHHDDYEDFAVGHTHRLARYSRRLMQQKQRKTDKKTKKKRKWPYLNHMANPGWAWLARIVLCPVKNNI